MTISVTRLWLDSNQCPKIYFGPGCQSGKFNLQNDEESAKFRCEKPDINMLTHELYMRQEL